MNFFISDTHFFHENVIGFCNRPFNSVEEMNEKMIENWNEFVLPEDHVWFLGDLSFGRVPETVAVLERLAGTKHLIMGNHDRKGRCEKLPWHKHFADVRDYYRFHESKTEKAVLCHFPLESWERGYYHFHGHLHTIRGDNTRRKWRRWDVGVDNNYYEPVSWERATAQADAWPKPEGGYY